MIRHGYKNTPTWMSWKSMRQRCLNPNATGYARYGGRGITICDRWLESFLNFLADMGARPAGTSLERINNDGNYEPSNCRWASRSEQSINQYKPKTRHRPIGSGLLIGKRAAMTCVRCHFTSTTFRSHASRKNVCRDGCLAEAS